MEVFPGGGENQGAPGVAPGGPLLKSHPLGQITFFGLGPFLTFQFLFLAFFRQEKTRPKTHLTFRSPFWGRQLFGSMNS